VHWIREKKDGDFSADAGKAFARRHARIEFDVLEGTEARAVARVAIKLVPDIPLVVRLHTPSFVVNELNYVAPSLVSRIRRFTGALRRGRVPKPFSTIKYNAQTDIEYTHTLQADEIVAPSEAILETLIEAWRLDKKNVSIIPNPYACPTELLNIPIESSTGTVSFIGRLEIRKGVLDLAQAIPAILSKYPNAVFRFIGPIWPSPDRRYDMKQYLEKTLKRHKGSLEFTGSLTPDNITHFLRATDICIFPSLWENFPYVCLEAMAAGRGIAASSSGGMAEILGGGTAGILLPPRSPDKIADAVIKLLDDPILRIKLGSAARSRVIAEYGFDQIAPLQEALYSRAIEKRKALGFRTLDA
jgi:glycosyltransferase involved in cell wall biosynthesis